MDRRGQLRLIDRQKQRRFRDGAFRYGAASRGIAAVTRPVAKLNLIGGKLCESARRMPAALDQIMRGLGQGHKIILKASPQACKILRNVPVEILREAGELRRVAA
jgi:hypothetical protein